MASLSEMDWRRANASLPAKALLPVTPPENPQQSETAMPQEAA
jgi:hypothetical protein